MPLKKPNRLIIFYLLILIFLVITPAIVAYSLGYTFNFTEGEIKETGGIFIKSKNTRLLIFINDELAKETGGFYGSTLISDVTPGAHLLRIEKEGYRPWSKRIKVEPFRVTEFRNVLLVSQKISIATSTEEFPPPPAPSQNKDDLKLDNKNNLLKVIDSASSTVIATNVNSFSIIEKTVFFVDKNGFLAKVNTEDNQLETIGRPGFFMSKNPIRFFKAPQGEILIIDSSGGLYILEDDNTITPLDGGITRVEFDETGGKVILLKEKSIEILWLKESAHQPFEKKYSRETIINLKLSLAEARWFYKDKAHIVFRTDEGIFLTEVDGRGGRNTFELISGKTNSLITSRETPNSIFFKKGKIPYKIDL